MFLVWLNLSETLLKGVAGAAQILWQEKGVVDALWFVKADCHWSVLLGDGCEKAWWRWCMEKTLKKMGEICDQQCTRT